MQSIDNIDKKLKSIAAMLNKIRDDHSWPSEMLLDQAIKQSLNYLEKHLEDLQKTAQSLLSISTTPQESADNVTALFHAWHMDKNPPSVLALCIFLLEAMELKPAPDDENMLLMSAILGQVHNEPAYHNDMHFRKVVAQIIRLIVANNTIYDGTPRALNTKQICTLMTAACIHDLDHDGQGNFVKGVHISGRAEKHSFNTAKPYLIASGCDEKTLNAIHVMLLTTDVSPLDDPANPMMQMKAAYRFHFLGDNTKAHTLNLSCEISALEKDPALTTLCLLLHEADIATSAAMTYDATKFETSLIMEEFKDDKAYPADVINFLDQICQRRFLSDAGVKLFAANMARIYALAQADFEGGNEAYPASPHADFIVPKNISSKNQTIN